MIPGLSGSLLSHDALTGALIDIGRKTTRPNYRWFHTWHSRIVREMGPTSTSRHVYDRVALPLATAIGLRVVPAVTPEAGSSVHGILYRDGLSVAALIVTGWGRDPS